MKIISVFLIALLFLACGPKKERIASHEMYGMRIESSVDVRGNLDGIERGYDAQSGVLLFERSWKKGKKDGIWRGYYPRGALKYEGVYKDNKPVGIWRFYDERGEITEEQLYNENGRYLRSRTP